MNSVYTDKVPKEMMGSGVNENGWYEWKLIPGSLAVDVYRAVETQYNVILPDNFIDWHRRYYFADGDCSLVRLPCSFPTEPLREIIDNLDWPIAEQLIPSGLIPFADEGNDAGPLVFDMRNQINRQDFPIRVYDHEYGGDLDGLTEIIFSSFNKMIACLTHYLNRTKTKNSFEVIPDFFFIDPTGAGSSGRTYWTNWTEMEKANFEEFGY